VPKGASVLDKPGTLSPEAQVRNPSSLFLSSLLLQFAYFEGYRGSVQLDFSFCDLFTEHLGETCLSRVITIVASNGKLKSCLNLDDDCCAFSCIKAGEGLGVHSGFLHLHENLYIS
jgi:hypothetical protein